MKVTKYLQVQSGDVREYQRLILLLYEKSGDNSAINQDNFRLGCCPKAGNFFRILNPIDARITKMNEQIDSFLEDNPDSPAAETLKSAKNVLQNIAELINPSGADRRVTGNRNDDIDINFKTIILRLFQIARNQNQT